MIQRLNGESGHQETLYLVQAADAGKADHARATALAADRCLHSAVNCVKFHLTTFCFLQEKLGTNPYTQGDLWPP